jgi:hypothetical protein
MAIGGAGIRQNGMGQAAIGALIRNLGNLVRKWQ